MKLEKIQLVNAPISTETDTLANLSCFPPAGLIALASYGKIFFPEIEFEILDGNIIGLENVINNLDADLVGINSYGSTHENSLKIAEAANHKGIITLLGGHHVYYLGKETLNNRPFVDYITRGDNAEESFREFLEFLSGKRNASKVSSLVHREGDTIISNNIKSLHIKDVPIFDRSFIDLKPYIKNYNRQFGKYHDKRITPSVTRNAQGCGRGSKNRCIYCNIPDMSFRNTSVERFWEEITYMEKKFGINFVYETADSLTSFVNIPYKNTNYLEALAEERPRELETELFVFARASEINDYTISLLKRLKVKRVNMGLDSGDDKMLRSGIGKGYTTLETNRGAVRLLDEANIQMYVSFVLGGIGETEESLENTFSFAKELFTYNDVIVVDPSPLLPLPGSPSWKSVSDAFVDQDLIDTEVAATLWAEGMCNVSYDTLKKYNNQIRELAAKNDAIVGGYGIKNI